MTNAHHGLQVRLDSWTQAVWHLMAPDGYTLSRERRAVRVPFDFDEPAPLDVFSVLCVFRRDGRSLTLLFSHFSSESRLSRDCRPDNSPSTLMSSSKSFQWIPSP